LIVMTVGLMFTVTTLSYRAISTLVKHKLYGVNITHE
jgi:hypothetical protein